MIRNGYEGFMQWAAAGLQLEGRQRWILSGLLAAGALLRIQQWLFCRSLWLDEAKLALNIANRSFGELLAPLDYNQAAGIGFLWVQKGLVSVFSDHEMVLRLLPLLAGITSLILFSRLVFSILPGLAPWIALALFAVNERQIYFANEAKQYGLDVFWVLLLLLLAVQLLRAGPGVRRIWPLGLLGFLAVWFSHPAVFVLAGVGLVLAWARWKNALEVSWPRLAAVGVLWIGGFLLTLWISLRALMANSMLQEYWQAAFMPWSWPEGFLWAGRAFSDFFVNPGALVVGLALPLFVVGAVVLGRQNPGHAALLLLPAGFTFTAAVFHLYPFQERLVLFLAPVAVGLTAQGAGALAGFCARRWERYRMLVLFLLGLLVVGVGWDSLRRTAVKACETQAREHIRPMLVRMRAAWQPGDRLYVYSHAWAPWRYYRKRLGLGDMDWVQGRADRQTASLFTEELRRLKDARRVWVLVSRYSRKPVYDCPDERAYILKLFTRLGPRRWHQEAPGASLTMFSGE